MDRLLCGRPRCLDTLVFSAGIGEDWPSIRARIGHGRGFLGIELNETRNAEKAPLISADAIPVSVRVIRTDEELRIAGSVTASSASAHLKKVEP